MTETISIKKIIIESGLAILFVFSGYAINNEIVLGIGALFIIFASIDILDIFLGKHIDNILTFFESKNKMVRNSNDE